MSLPHPDPYPDIDDPAFYLGKVKDSDFHLDRVPWDRRSEELCYETVKRNPFDIRYVPESEKSARVCKEAMRECLLIEYIPEKYLTRKYCLEAMNESCGFYKHVPDRILHTKKFLHDVFKVRGMTLTCSIHYRPFLESLPKSLLDDKLLSHIARAIPFAIQHFPRLQEQKYAEKSVLEYGDVFLAICRYGNLDADKLLYLAVAKSKQPITSYSFIHQYVSSNNPAHVRIVEAAAKIYEDLLAYLPESFPRYSEFVKTSVSTFGTSLRYVPESRRTPALCKMAYKASPEAANYFPENNGLRAMPGRKREWRRT